MWQFNFAVFLTYFVLQNVPDFYFKVRQVLQSVTLITKRDVTGNNILTRRRVNSMRHGTETVSFLASKIWDILQKEIKDSESLDIFKRKIKKWIPQECLCKTLWNICTESRIYLSSENQRYISLTNLTSISFSATVKMLV